MPNTRNRIGLSLLLEAFALPYSVYVLGSGTSAGTTPTIPELRSKILKRIWEFGAIPAEPLVQPLDATARRIMGISGDQSDLWTQENQFEKELLSRLSSSSHPDSLFAEIALEQELVSRFSSEAIKAIAISLLSPTPPALCPQYQVFQLARKPSSIFNLNVDRLASQYCTGHKILNLHGTAPSREILDFVGWRELEDGLLEFSDLHSPSIPGFVHIGPEPLTVTQTRAYSCAMHLLPCAQYVIFVGYAFGGMDDFYTYKFLCAHLRRLSTPVVVVDLNPSDLVLRIQAEVKSAKVYGLEADWDFLAQAIMQTVRARRHKWCSLNRLCSTCVSYSYKRLRDNGRAVSR